MIIPGTEYQYETAKLFFGTKHDDKPFNAKSVKQVHGNVVLNVINHDQNTSSVEADALITNLVGVILCVYTADCVPILLYDQNGVIAAVHAGWRGAAAGIIQNTISAMSQLSPKTNNIVAFVGPCIQQPSYEVNEVLMKEFPGYEGFFKAHGNEKFLFDLPGYCKEILLQMNVKNVHDIALETYGEDSNFFSYRYSTHKNIPISTHQRQFSYIRL